VRTYGLTGGIASGKSTVARRFTELGVPVVDADALARRVVEPGQPALAEIIERFGADVLNPDGTLDRQRLGARVFAAPAERAELERITHPRIVALGRAELERHALAGARYALYEAALLVEKRLHEAMDGLIVVAAPPEVQLARLMARDRLDRAAAEGRLAAQLPLADKIREASWVIDNGGSPAATTARVAEIWPALEAADG